MRRVGPAAIGLALLVALVARAAPAAELPPDLAALIAAAPRAEDLPDAAAVYLRDAKVFAIDETGRVVTTLRQTIKILRASGARRHAEVVLPSTSPSQRVTVNVARTVRPDGRVCEVAGADALESAPAGLYGATYGDFLRWQLWLPYVEPGAVVDYEVTIADTQPTMPDSFADRFVMQGIDPILSSTYTVRAPADTLVRSVVHGHLDPPLVVRRGMWNETTWRAVDVPAVADEPNRPNFLAVATWVLVSSTPTWDAVADHYRRLAADRYAPYAPLQGAVRRLTDGAADPVTALYHYVSTRVRYGLGPLEAGSPGIQPRRAAETFDLGVGDCKDQATLLITMLREAGRTAWPALVHRGYGSRPFEELPAMLQFDHVIVALPRPDGSFGWLDPTWSFGPADYLPPDLQGGRALVVQDDRAVWVTLPVHQAEANTHRREADLELGPDLSLSGTVTLSATGAMERALRLAFRERSAASMARLISYGADDGGGLAERVPNPVVEPESVAATPAGDLERPFSLRYRFHTDPYARRAGRLVVLQPAVFDRAEAPPGLAAAGRSYDYELVAAPQHTISSVRFRLPADLAVTERPTAIEGQESFGSFRVTYRLRDNILEYTREVRIDRAVLAPGELEQARRWYRALSEADGGLVVLARP